MKLTQDQCSTILSSDAIIKVKGKHISSLGDKLNDPQTGAKSYWSILNIFLQKKKIGLIPPTFFNGTFITKICEKINLFNTFFADQCTLSNNINLLFPFGSIVILIIFHLQKMK